MTADPGRVRIIGGRWRGRRLPVADLPGLRPTGDRARETLFNWLAPVIEGSRCLDCFAGSGALGFEAASRGARRVTLIERARPAARVLQANAERLGAGAIEVVAEDALIWLERAAGEPYDVCFLDPPFADALLAPALERLVAGGWLAAGARVYFERDPAAGGVALPAGWRWLREKRAGRVCFALAEAGPA